MQQWRNGSSRVWCAFVLMVRRAMCAQVNELLDELDGAGWPHPGVCVPWGPPFRCRPGSGMCGRGWAVNKH
jgi:hypothetical protein